MAGILIAEDDVSILRLLSIWLKRNGHLIDEAQDGLQAQRRLEDCTYDLLITDANMPGLDGEALIGWLRNEFESQIPVILLTSRCDQGQLAQRMAPFAVRVHPKPFSPSYLVAVINEMLSNARCAAAHDENCVPAKTSAQPGVAKP